MKAFKNLPELLSAARALESASRLTESADVYQQVINADPTNQQAVSRLLTVYRRLKEPKKELALIKNALAAYAQKDKTTQEKWLDAHPQAARASRAFLRSLGGSSVSSFGANAQVQRLLKRKEVVEKKVYGKAKGKKFKKTAAAAAKKTSAAGRKAVAGAASKAVAAAARKAEAAEQKRQTAAARREAAEQKRQAAAARKAAEAERKAQAAARQQAAAAAAEARRQAAIPSLFVISIRYLAPLDAIDAMLPKHTAFLDKHFAAGDFLAAGRQIPRTGGIIIARGKSRAGIESIMKQDPFLKNKLASIDIVEFAAGKISKKPW